MTRGSAGLIASVSLLSASLASAKPNFIPPNGFVPNEQTAIAIARAVLVPIYGADTIKDEEPLTAKRDGDDWIVTGTLQCAPRCMGGTAEVRLSSKDGRILNMIHGK